LFGLGGVNMRDGERSDTGGRSDWLVRLSGAVGACVGAAVALFVVKPLLGDLGFWPGLIAFVVVVVGALLVGRLVGGLLFRPSGGPPDHPPHA
jgi:hypothetical protein